MKLQSALLLALITAVTTWSYEIPDENVVTTRTCRLAVKLEVIRDETMERPSGRALVIAHLYDENGNGYRGERIELTASAGTFICRLPDDSSTADAELSEDCFSTRDDGNARLYLVNIPFNQRVQIKATYNCDERIITSTASLSVSRQTIKKKTKAAPAKPSRP